MSPTQLLYLLHQAHTLHAKTHDPVIPSAIRLLTDAYTQALVYDEPVVALSEQQSAALRYLQALADAHLTLFGESVKPPSYEHSDDP